ncbi:MAG: hypothetical protein KGY75_05935 [Candidatus Cloacimonetes bacterium]|nr:hypothetical protein [Candidatus Cloacimonadota bacterium]
MNLEPRLYYLKVALPTPEQSKKEIEQELKYLLKLLKTLPLTPYNQRIIKLKQSWCRAYEDHTRFRFLLQQKQSYAKLYLVLDQFYTSLKSQKSLDNILRSTVKVKQELAKAQYSSIRKNPEYDNLWRTLTALYELHHKLLRPGTEKTDKRKARKLKQTAASKDSACTKNFMSRNRSRFTASLFNQADIETDYFAFLENIALDLLNYIKHNRDLLQVKQDAEYIVEEAKGKSNINPFFMFLTWNAQPEWWLQIINENENYFFYWQQFKRHLKYHIFYRDQLAAAHPKPYKSKLVEVSTLREVVRVRKNPPQDHSYLRILEATARYLSQADQKISAKTLRRWIKYNRKFYPKFSKMKIADVVNKLSPYDCIEWFENLKWVDSYFAGKLKSSYRL